MPPAGGARANGLKASVAGSVRRSRCASICLITIGSSRFAITFTARQPGTWRFVRDGRPLTVRASGRVQVNSAIMVRHLVLSGVGIGLCPEFVVREDPVAGRRVQLLSALSAYERGTDAVYPHTRHVPG